MNGYEDSDFKSDLEEIIPAWAMETTWKKPSNERALIIQGWTQACLQNDEAYSDAQVLFCVAMENW